MTLTYKKKIDDVTDNAVVRQLTGVVAEALQVPYSRVTDAYGGYSGYKSPDLPAAPAAPAAKNTTNTTKRMLATNASNTTPSSYPVNIYV